MSNFRFVTHLDTYAAAARLHALAPKLWGDPSKFEEMTDAGMEHKTFVLRAHDGWAVDNWLEDRACKDLPAYTEFKSLRALVAKARKAVLEDQGLSALADATAPLGRVCVSVLAPRGVMAWHADVGPYYERHLRFHVPLTTNPGCLLYCGNEQLHVPIGALLWLNNREKHSAANWGQQARAHLIFEVRLRAAPDQEEAA